MEVCLTTWVCTQPNLHDSIFLASDMWLILSLRWHKSLSLLFFSHDPLSSFSWRSSGAFFSPQPKRRYRRVWWTTSVCSSLSVVAPYALHSLLSFRRLRQLKATSTTTDAAGPSADILSHSNTRHDHRTKTVGTLFSFYSAIATSFPSTFEAENNFTFNYDKVSSE